MAPVDHGSELHVYDAEHEANVVNMSEVKEKMVINLTIFACLEY